MHIVWVSGHESLDINKATHVAAHAYITWRLPKTVNAHHRHQNGPASPIRRNPGTLQTRQKKIPATSFSAIQKKATTLRRLQMNVSPQHPLPCYLPPSTSLTLQSVPHLAPCTTRYGSANKPRTYSHLLPFLWQWMACLVNWNLGSI